MSPQNAGEFDILSAQATRSTMTQMDASGLRLIYFVNFELSCMRCLEKERVVRMTAASMAG